MCGINGIYTFSNKESVGIIKQKLCVMNTLLHHRGPDDEGVFIDQNANFTVGLGHRRLSIIDIKNGNQPIFTNDKQQVSVYNGEVYNFKKLKEKYFTKEEIFATQTDTEVVLNLYKKFGVSSFSMLEGMYAFSIYDKEKEKIFIVRDFFGEKPLYYTNQKSGFYWSSELKSLTKISNNKPHIDVVGLNLFFRLTYIPAPFTIYKNINKLEPYHYIEIDCPSGDFKIKKIENEINFQGSYSFEEAKKKTFELVEESVVSRLVADVPVGAFLSGGVDSSIVSLCAARNSSSQLNTFSIGFEKKSFDETKKSRLISQIIKSNHHEFTINEDDLIGITDTILLNFDEPFSDSSALPSYFVAFHTSKYAKVALTGDGGDEVFGGYNKYLMGNFNSNYTKWINRNFHNSLLSLITPLLNNKEDNRGLRFKLNRLFKGIDYDDNYYFNIISLGFQEEEISSLLSSKNFYSKPLDFYKSQLSSFSSLNDFKQIDYKISLEGDMAVKVDRTAMLNSIETRAPFLNKLIWDFTLSLPENYLIHGFNKKYLLKKAFEKEFPKGFLDIPKQGFGVPIGDWLRKSFSKELKSYIDPFFLSKQALFNAPYITNMVNNHLDGRVDNTFRVWSFFCFQKWYKHNYEN